MFDDILNLLAQYKADLSFSKGLRYAFSLYDDAYASGKEDMLEDIVENLQEIVNRNLMQK